MCVEICESVSIWKELLSLAGVILGVIIGGTITFLTTFYSEDRKHEKESRRLALAFLLR